MHRFQVLIFIMFPMILFNKLNDCRAKPAKNIKLNFMPKMTDMNTMYLKALLPVSKNYKTLPVYRGHHWPILYGVS